MITSDEPLAELKHQVKNNAYLFSWALLEVDMTVAAGEVREVTMTDSDKVVDGHADDPQNVCDSLYPRLNVSAISKLGLFHDG